MSDFNMSDEHRMLADTLRKVLGGADAGMADLAEAGAFAALLPEGQGGFGGGADDIALVFRQVGLHGPAMPLVDHLIGLRILAGAGQDDLRDQALAGEVVLTLAHVEPGMESELDAPQMDLAMDGTLTGDKCVVAGLGGATHAIVTTQSGVCLVALDGVSTRAGRMLDGTKGGTLSFAQTPAKHVARPDALGTARRMGMLASCAEMLGLMERARDLTQGYLATRKQFCRAINSFQAIAFRLADMATEIEMARASVDMFINAPDDDATAAAAQAHVGRIASIVAEEAVQLHGGIGVTEEYELAPLVKRLWAADARFGDHHLHLHRFTQMQALTHKEAAHA